MILTLICWVALIAFIGLSAKKAIAYGKMPQHGRQDLYPIPLESDEKMHYGGSYMEEDKWYEISYLLSIIFYLLSARIFAHAMLPAPHYQGT
ncbi:MAG: hypothetical protein II218_00485 [Peptococcaceae bacterium]|nr:hypothetical protein [Peptococcaceae bacterium]